MTAVTETCTWTLVVPAPTVYVVKRGKKGEPKPPGGWPKRPAAGWLSMNGDKGNHWAKNDLRKDWREATQAAAMVARLPRGAVTRARFDVVLRFVRIVRRDPANWHPTAKVILDTLTKGTRTYPGWGFLPDDAPKFLHCEDCPHLRVSPIPLQVGPLGPFGVLELTITDLSEVAS